MRVGNLAPANIWLWLLQRISAVLLVVVLGVHLWLANFGQATASLRAVLGVVLLALALLHGLNGVRAVILDFSPGIQGRRFLTTILLLLGAALLLFGLHGLWPLIVGG